MATDQVPKADALYNEAPASWNVRYTTTSGFVCQLTLRSETGLDLLSKADAALSFLLESGFTPDVYHQKSNGDRKLCSIHNVEMGRHEKFDRFWYSHKLEDGSWCKGRQQGNGGQHE